MEAVGSGVLGYFEAVKIVLRAGEVGGVRQTSGCVFLRVSYD
jgi:hypothetical protein